MCALRKSRLDSTSIYSRRISPLIDAWFGYQNNLSGPILAPAIGEVDENGRIINRYDIDVVRAGQEYVKTLEMTGARPML